jgi:hypothetical protein
MSVIRAVLLWLLFLCSGWVAAILLLLLLLQLLLPVALLPVALLPVALLPVLVAIWLLLLEW